MLHAHFVRGFLACVFCFCIFFWRWANLVAGLRGVWRWFLDMVMVLLCDSTGVRHGLEEYRERMLKKVGLAVANQAHHPHRQKFAGA